MNKGDRRNAIMAKCPEGFEDELNSFIDDLEDELSNILSDFVLDDITDIGKIEAAYNGVDELHDSLY